MTGDPERSGAYGPGLLELLERRVMKTRVVDNPLQFEQASPDHRVTPEAPPMFVLHGTHDTLVPVAVARYFVDQLVAASEAPVAYAELPGAQHAFEVLASIRSRHTTMGAVRFLEAMRTRVDRRSSPAPIGGAAPAPMGGADPDVMST
jgi:acetyl esterase/lipase